MPVSSAPKASLDLLRNSDWLHAAYQERLLSRREIAKELGVAPSTVGHWMEVHGIQSRDSVTARQQNAASNRPDELDDAKWLFDRYYEDGLTLEAIGDQVGVSPSAVRSAMDRHGIPTRSKRLGDRTWLAFEVGAKGAVAVADQLNTSASTVYRWLKRHRLPTKGWRATIQDDGMILARGHEATPARTADVAPGPIDGATALALDPEVLAQVIAATSRR